MFIREKDGLRTLMPDENCLLYNKETNGYHKKVYLGIHASSDAYLDVNIQDIENHESTQDIDEIKVQQNLHGTQIISNMTAIASLYEIIMGAVMINAKNGIATPHEILQTYETLLSQNIKTLNEIPDYVRNQLNLK